MTLIALLHAAQDRSALLALLETELAPLSVTGDLPEDGPSRSYSGVMNVFSDCSSPAGWELDLRCITLDAEGPVGRPTVACEASADPGGIPCPDGDGELEL